MEMSQQIRLMFKEMHYQFLFESVTECCHTWLVANCSKLQTYRKQKSTTWLMFPPTVAGCAMNDIENSLHSITV